MEIMQPYEGISPAYSHYVAHYHYKRNESGHCASLYHNAYLDSSLAADTAPLVIAPMSLALAAR